MKPQDQLVRRYEGNPILTAADWPHTVNAVLNAGAVRLADGTTLLLCRVEDRRGISSLWAVRSADGVSNWRIDPEPALLPDPLEHPEEAWGVEDPRIVRLEELGRYAITYTAYSQAGPAVSLALTPDFRSYERVGVVMPPADKNAALLPVRYDGRWLMLHRPDIHSGSNIWLSESPDLIHWGRHRLLLAVRRGAWWDAVKIGIGPPLVRTERGWLMLYHGVRVTAAGALYRVGVALLDLDDPRKVLMRGDEWIFGPSERYEREGDVGGVVFPCGCVLDPDSETLHLYYGAADTSIGLARVNIPELLDWLETHSSRPAPQSF